MSDGKHYNSAELNQQTARVSWQEIEPHFARGVVIQVAGELDLIEVATGFANDDKAAVEQWMSKGKVKHLNTDVASTWSRHEPDLWAVVVAPWVLVQERHTCDD